MKKSIRLILTSLFIISLFTGMLVAYAETRNEASAREAFRDLPGSHGFSLSMAYGGDHDVDTAFVKIEDVHNAYFYLTTLNNTTGQYAYLNMRSIDGQTIVGIQKGLHPSLTAPYSTTVDYKTGHGNTTVFYSPSGQSSSLSIVGSVYIAGFWIP